MMNITDLVFFIYTNQACASISKVAEQINHFPVATVGCQYVTWL